MMHKKEFSGDQFLSAFNVWRRAGGDLASFNGYIGITTEWTGHIFLHMTITFDSDDQRVLDTATDRLQSLLGPHAYTVAKAYLARSKRRFKFSNLLPKWLKRGN